MRKVFKVKSLFLLAILTMVLNGCSEPVKLEQPNNTLEEKVASVITPDELIQKELLNQTGIPVNIAIDQHSQNNGWHFYVGHPVTLDGKRLDISKTKFSKDYEEGFFDDIFVALVKNENNQFSLVEFSYGATDAPFVGWGEKHHINFCLFSEASSCNQED